MLTTLRESFAPLQIRNFRVYMGGQLVSLLGTWMQVTAQGWLVWELSQSTEALGIVSMLGALPILILGLLSGVWADRMDRRKLLIILQISAMILAFIQAFLIQTETIQLWHVYVLSFLLGIVSAIDMPTQQAFIGDLTGMGQVRKAVVVNAMALQVSRTLGPALAGFIIGRLGMSRAFWLNGLSYFAVVASLIAVRSAQVRASPTQHAGGQLGAGLRFISSQPRLQDLLIFTSLITFFGLSVINVFPAVASDILKGNAETLGFLMGSSGAGALTGALFVVPFAQARRRTGLVIGSVVLWMGVWLILASNMTILPLSMLCIFLFSIGAPVVITTSLGLVQVMSPPNMRTQLQSLLFTVTFGLQPIASLLIGYSASHFGTGTAIEINGVLMIMGAVVLLAARSKLRQWEFTSQSPAMPQELG